MTSTSTRPDKTATPATGTAAPVPVPGPVPKMRRRPAVAAAALAAAVFGAIATGWAWSSTTASTQVVVVTGDVPRGAVITAGDLGVARITLDPALRPVDASQRGDIVGQRAATALSVGAIVTASMFEPETVPGEGMSLVPVALPPEQSLGLNLQGGDQVKIVETPPAGQATEGNPPFTVAEVAAVHPVIETGATVVSVTVPAADAPVLAARIASGNFYLVLDAREVN
ncbi:SAF domain-containing protein [Pengzhenrongella sicca]|uniref:SAF domain-containing protein n=1 Tax=Pengzhenrongella sicca TaxID=2819238 RepID=A0A8A4ZAX9_9MICO|nr:SAF domain-containing protein [Pengzhenrongella sicca]QTE28575.1 SAF domain-containing protein [Pengzhenrongella sicca]